MLKKLSRVIPIASVWIFIAALLCAGIQIACTISMPFAEWFNATVAAFFRATLSYLTVWMPFSLAETIIYCLPAAFVILLVLCIRAARDGLARAMRYVFGVLSIGALVYVLFVLTFSAGYRTAPLNEKMGIETEKLSAEDLFDAAAILADRAEETLDEITFRPDGASVMPYSYNTLSAKLMDAYGQVSAKYPFIQTFESRVKPLSISPLMTYTHISGVYTMFTGEANLNVNFPDYVIAYTAAHELAHQRGIARENEANFVAFLVCEASDDPYIRYSGYLNMYEYVASALYSASPEMYRALNNTVDARLRREMIAYSAFFEPYRQTVVSEISDKVNDTYLTLQGTEGVKSYGMVVDLAVAYLKENP